MFTVLGWTVIGALCGAPVLGLIVGLVVLALEAP